jgi:hypothetical protein
MQYLPPSLELNIYQIFTGIIIYIWRITAELSLPTSFVPSCIKMKPDMPPVFHVQVQVYPPHSSHFFSSQHASFCGWLPTLIEQLATTVTPNHLHDLCLDNRPHYHTEQTHSVLQNPLYALT